MRAAARAFFGDRGKLGEAAQHVVAIDEVMLDRGRDVHDHEREQGEVERLVRELQRLRKRLVLADQVRELPEPEIHRRHADRRAVEPAR